MNTPRRLIPVTRLTETSARGRYVVVTAARTTYFVDVDPDQLVRIVRHPLRAGLLHDGKPIPGVASVDFDTITGLGRLWWWKDNPLHYDPPGEPYLGTLRRTSTVRLIARVWPLGDATPLADTALLGAVAALDVGCNDDVLSEAVRGAWDSALDVSSIPPHILPDPTEPPDASWARIVGACFTTRTFAAALGMSEAEVARAADELRILRLITRDGIPLFPAFQVQGGQVVPGLQVVLLALRAGTEDPWAYAEWLNTPVPLHNGSGTKRRWIAELRAGNDESVLRAAIQTAASWSS